MKHALTLNDFSRREVMHLLDRAMDIKHYPGAYADAMAGRVLLMAFEKPSLRTRLSFEAGMFRMGGHAIYYDLAASPLGKGKESIEDTAATSTRYVDLVMIRAFKQSMIRAFAQHSRVPVIDGLSDNGHPCQILADLMTMQEYGKDLSSMKLAYFGNGNNNVAFDLSRACSMLGIECWLASPPKAAVPDRVLAECRGPGKVIVTRDAKKAASGADVVYTDTWANYGVKPDAKWLRALAPYRVTQALMKRAARDAVFMHCLPAQRGKEVEAAVIDGRQSVVFDQAENRMWAQDALMLHLLNPMF